MTRAAFVVLAAAAVLALSGCPKSNDAPAAPKHPAECEVEITGTLQLPPDAPADGAVWVSVAVGDCLAEGAKVVGQTKAKAGDYFIEVFAPWGSDLTVCAFVEPAAGGPSAFYGKHDKSFHAEKEGEVTLGGVSLVAAAGAPRTFSHVVAPPSR